jgi:hypothetical protein
LAAELVDKVIRVDDFDADLGITDAITAASARQSENEKQSADVAPVRSTPPRRAA